MHQQINLFQPVFRKQQKVFSAITLAQISGAVAVLLLLFVAHANWTLANMQASADSLQQQYEHLHQQISALEATRRTPVTESLDSEIEKLQSRIEKRSELLAGFDDLALESQSCFHTRLRTLAEQHIPGLWLEGLSVDNHARIEIRGSTLEAQLVPVYLQQLSRQADLSTTPFETVQLARPDARQPQIGFVLRNFREDQAWD
jgi:cell division protein FtsB